MTKAQLRTIVENSVNHCIYCCGTQDNPNLPERDVEEVVKPVVTLAVLHGYTWLTYESAIDLDVMLAYLKSLSLVVRLGGSYIDEMRELIVSQYNAILAEVKDDDTITNFDLMIVLNDLLEEAEK